MKYKNYRDVYYVMEDEGIGYFITSYTSAESMPDKKGEELFRNAEQALIDFEEYVNEQFNESEDTEDIGE